MTAKPALKKILKGILKRGKRYPRDYNEQIYNAGQTIKRNLRKHHKISKVIGINIHISIITVSIELS